VVLQSGIAAVAALAVAGTGSAAPDSQCTVAAEAVAVAQNLEAGPESQYIAVALDLLQSLWAEGRVRPGSRRVAHMAAAVVVVVAAGHIGAVQVGRCCRPLSMSWTQRTW
jgi:hypothetical protein